MGMTDNEIFIDAPIDDVFFITNQIENWKDLFSEYAESTILKQEGHKITFKLTTVPDKEGNQKSWISERIVNHDIYTCDAERIEPKYPFEFMKIHWEYKQHGEGTIMRWIQKFEVAKTCPWTTEKMEDYLNENTKIQMSVIKERIEKK